MRTREGVVAGERCRRERLCAAVCARERALPPSERPRGREREALRQALRRSWQRAAGSFRPQASSPTRPRRLAARARRPRLPKQEAGGVLAAAAPPTHLTPQLEGLRQGEVARRRPGRYHDHVGAERQRARAHAASLVLRPRLHLLRAGRRGRDSWHVAARARAGPRGAAAPRHPSVLPAEAWITFSTARIFRRVSSRDAVPPAPVPSRSPPQPTPHPPAHQHLLLPDRVLLVARVGRQTERLRLRDLPGRHVWHIAAGPKAHTRARTRRGGGSRAATRRQTPHTHTHTHTVSRRDSRSRAGSARARGWRSSQLRLRDGRGRGPRQRERGAGTRVAAPPGAQPEGSRTWPCGRTAAWASP